jgi:thymidylate kinase
MNTRRIAITGTDGTGKTTVIRLLDERFKQQPGFLKAFRAPQYHEDLDAPFGRLSAAIDALSVLGDRLGDPLLKTTALFLSMTLYGDVEACLMNSFRPRFLVAERQCLADSLTYSRFYLPYLKGPLDRTRLEAPMLETLQTVEPDAWKRLEAWLGVVHSRILSFDGLVEKYPSFWDLPLLIGELFSLPPNNLMGALQALYHAEFPDQIILLKINPDAQAERLAQKSGQAPQELHEQKHVLAMFQKGLEETCDQLKLVAPNLVITPIEVSLQTPLQTVESVLEAIQGVPERLQKAKP